ncbi:hypothetical protein ACNAWD_22235 [Rhodococcus erythropolis]|uniref:hypothetical protein n=1 Tax=Rhodococcus TaxID=1827 RepID=UPI000F7429B9|nr:hypothetical protein [Rhodococcus erythropolis]
MASDQDFDVRQNRIIEILRDRNPRLAGVYRMALGALCSEVELDCEPARISVVCHCMRELMNGLPVILAETSIPRPNPSSSSLTKGLPRLLADHPDVDLGADQDIVPVPKAVAQAFDRLITAVVQEEGRNRSNASALVTGIMKDKHPAVNQWLEAYQFFLGWTHIDRNHESERKLPDDARILAVMKIVEDIIEVRTTVFFENLRSLEELLTQINAPVEGDM